MSFRKVSSFLYKGGNRETFDKNEKPEGNLLETISLKALAGKVLQRNHKGNLLETKSFHRGKNEGVKVSTIVEGEKFEERAAIMEFDGNLPRSEAERQAAAGIIDQFVAEAREVFRINEVHETCPACKGNNFWISKYGAVICRQCHPPVRGAEKKGSICS